MWVERITSGFGKVGRIALPVLFTLGIMGFGGLYMKGWRLGLPWERKPESPKVTVPSPENDVISTFTLVGHSETGRKKWEIQGRTADLMAGTVFLSPVSATNFGNVDTHLTAKTGKFDRGTQDIHLEEDVVVTTSDGARLTTDSFDWMAQREMGSTQDWVTVTRPGMVVYGRGGVGFPNLKRFRLKEQVTVTLQGKDGKTVVTCDGPMEVDYGRSKARFWRNVKVRDTKGLIQSDRMDVLLDSQTKQMREATFWGHVEITHETQIARANRAKYWQPNGHTLLVGHPRVMMLASDSNRVGE